MKGRIRMKSIMRKEIKVRGIRSATSRYKNGRKEKEIPKMMHRTEHSTGK